MFIVFCRPCRPYDASCVLLCCFAPVSELWPNRSSDVWLYKNAFMLMLIVHASGNCWCAYPHDVEAHSCATVRCLHVCLSVPVALRSTATCAQTVSS